jgi:uncharacterized membrane protein YkvI
MKVRLLSFFLVILLLSPLVVAAQSNPCTSGGATGNIGRCVSQVYVWSLGISGFLAVAMAVFGGFLVMTARGNGQQASKGKSFILSSLAGMVLLLAAYLLLNTINPDLTQFTVPSIESNNTR